MAAPMEVAVCTDSAAQLWSCVVWELHSGANLLTYRGGQAGPRGLALLNGEYLLAAQLGKNYISAWELQRKDQLQQKIMCPGPVTCLTTSPNGLYVLAGIAESIYLWEVSTGNLLVILSRHYQDVSCLQFTGDSSHFLSGGKDCLVLAWSLCSVLQVDPSRTPAPRHVWSRHTLPITDLHCGFGGPLARVATSSLDQTVKLWEVSSGELLLSVLFDVGIMAVTMDLAEHHLFCGGSDGSIFQVDLCTWPGQREKSFQPEQDNGKVFRGHRNQVTCLSVSTDGSVLLSGSHDETVRLWDIQSKQCIRTVTLKGPVTNASIMLAPVSMLSSDFRPGLPLPHFNKHLLGAEHGDEPHRGGFTLRLGLHQQLRAPGGRPSLTRTLCVAGLGAQPPGAGGAAARGDEQHDGEERPRRPGPAADPRGRAGGRGAQPAQGQPRPLRLLHAHHHAAGQVSALRPARGPPRGLVSSSCWAAGLSVASRCYSFLTKELKTLLFGPLCQGRPGPRSPALGQDLPRRNRWVHL
ncbi:WD repeat-containing protein 18 isoform X1 [Canis lupus familiaris]|uniref:WD repeat-containing protein 18 isoform X1 n=1 Tax=Canis lupus familiaris TaxID=9615 RepID=UPI0018F6EEFC|nr:WD repeat-containing protein 18 isoform X1 [Canis lupus familiaris]